MSVKTLVLAALIAAIAFAGCAGSPAASGNKTSGQTKRASNDLFSQLDPVIEKTFDKLSGRLKPGLRIALLPPNSTDQSAGEYVFDELYELFVDSDMYDVPDRNDINKARSEIKFSWNGEVDESTAASAGKFLGANVVVFGSLPDIGTDRRRLVYRALEVETGRMLGISSERF